MPLDAKGALKQPTQPGFEMYDLIRDPQELNNIYGQPAYLEIQEKLKRQMEKAKEKYRDEDYDYKELKRLYETFEET